MTDAIYNMMNQIIQFQPSFSESFRSGCDFSDVTFKHDFGPWKKGEHVELLCLNLESLTLEEFDIEKADLLTSGLPVFKKLCKLTLTPKETHGTQPKPKRRKNT
jgi:hypothetical protein